MISKIIGMLFQQWLVGRSRVFGIWLFGTEAAAAVVIAGLSFAEGFRADGWVGPFFVWYVFVCGTEFFDWERKRTLKRAEAWEAPRFAKVCALFYSLGFTAGGLCLLTLAFGESIAVMVIGIAVFGLGATQLYSTWKHGWPGLGV